jgi:hypothetical protein
VIMQESNNSNNSSSTRVGVDGNVVTLTMEGVGNNAPIGSYYESMYGVTFDADALTLVDQDVGGSGNFAFAPSQSTTVQFYQKDTIVMNVNGGFETGLSFYYSSITRNGSVTVYDGVNATGNVRAFQHFYPLGFYRGDGDPTGDFNRWRGVGLTFDGVARSVVFRGAVNRMLLDDIALGSATSRCPPTNGTGSPSRFELWNGNTDSRTAKLVEGGSYCLAGNWNVRVQTSHEMSTCGPILIKFFTGRTVLRRQVEASPSYFLFGDNPVTRDVYGNTNARPAVSSSVALTSGTTYCVRAAEAGVQGYSQVCFVHKC